MNDELDFRKVLTALWDDAKYMDLTEAEGEAEARAIVLDHVTHPVEPQVLAE